MTWHFYANSPNSHEWYRVSEEDYQTEEVCRDIYFRIGKYDITVVDHITIEMVLRVNPKFVYRWILQLEGEPK